MNRHQQHTPFSGPGAARTEAIHNILEKYAGTENHDLLAEMIVTICRLGKDATGRGEVKILNTALKELRYAFKVFEPYRQTRKVSIFGSSRTPEGHPQYEAAVEYARLMTEAGWMVITGAGDGIMRAGHHGAKREASFGVAIRLPFEQATNTIIANDAKLINFKYFFTRKLMFVKEADAIALFPGGFGTQDEGFEALTLIQTGKAHMMPVVLVDEPGGTYWDHWKRYVEAELLAKGMISPEDLNLFHITDQPGGAVAHVAQFYRRYHSSRMVGDLLAIRLTSPLQPAHIDQLNDRYGDIITGGRIEYSPGPIDGEYDEWPDYPRVVMQFNRMSIGRLRRMVDEINAFD